MEKLREESGNSSLDLSPGPEISSAGFRPDIEAKPSSGVEEREKGSGGGGNGFPMAGWQQTCQICGFSMMIPTGNCFVCPNCGSSGGCS